VKEGVVRSFHEVHQAVHFFNPFSEADGQGQVRVHCVGAITFTVLIIGLLVDGVLALGTQEDANDLTCPFLEDGPCVVILGAQEEANDVTCLFLEVGP